MIDRTSSNFASGITSHTHRPAVSGKYWHDCSRTDFALYHKTVISQSSWRMARLPRYPERGVIAWPREFSCRLTTDDPTTVTTLNSSSDLFVPRTTALVFVHTFKSTFPYFQHLQDSAIVVRDIGVGGGPSRCNSRISTGQQNHQHYISH